MNISLLLSVWVSVFAFAKETTVLVTKIYWVYAVPKGERQTPLQNYFRSRNTQKLCTINVLIKCFLSANYRKEKEKFCSQIAYGLQKISLTYLTLFVLFECLSIS